MLNKGPVVPKREGTARWLYEELRRLGVSSNQAYSSIVAIGRGEQPDGSGDPLTVLDDYFYLPGRRGGQLGHGGQNNAENLTLKSTRAGTKGFIYLGSSSGLAYDETNVRVGLATAAPAAKLHMTVGAVSGQSAVPTTGTASGAWSLVGSSYAVALSDTDPATYAAWNDIGIGSSATLSGNLTNSLVDPGVTSGFSVKVSGFATSNTTGNGAIELQLINQSSGITFKDIYIRGPNDTTHTPVDIQFTTSNTTYTVPLTALEVSRMNFAAQQPFRYQFAFTGFTVSNSSAFIITRLELVLPPAGGAVGDLLQKWQNDVNSNTMAYAVDGLGNTAMKLYGDRVNLAPSALEFEIGTPVSGYPWVSQNTVGTGAWVDPATLRTRELVRWTGNGPYRVDTSVDGAHIIPATAFTISTIKFWRSVAGSGGTTTAVVKKNGSTTISTININASDGSNFVATGTIANGSCVAGDKLTVDITAVETGTPQHWALILEGA